MAKREKDMDVSDDTGAEARVYELGFHLDPELPAEEVKKAYQKVRELIAEKGTIVAEGEPMMIQLAYTISRQETSGRRDFSSAYFSWIAYEALPQNHEEVVSAAGSNTQIVRFVDLITTKEAARHAAEMREMALKAPEARAEESSEETSNTELDAAIENLVV